MKFRPLHVWRIPIDPKRHTKSWFVAIYSTEKELNDWLRALPFQTKDRRHFLACCVPMSIKGHPDFLGYVVFSQERIDGGIVAHEMTHAVCRYLKTERYGLSRGRREERFARLVEHMVTQFWRKWYRYAEE